MPNYTARDGTVHNLADWPGNSHKAEVINAAYAASQFDVVNVLGQITVFFRCGWCQKLITSAGVAGDHVVGQALGNSGNAELEGLFALADGGKWNRVLACIECNSGSRNKAKVMTRSAFAKDRDKQGPKPPDGGLGGGGGVLVS